MACPKFCRVSFAILLLYKCSLPASGRSHGIWGPFGFARRRHRRIRRSCYYACEDGRSISVGDTAGVAVRDVVGMVAKTRPSQLSEECSMPGYEVVRKQISTYGDDEVVEERTFITVRCADSALHRQQRSASAPPDVRLQEAEGLTSVPQQAPESQLHLVPPSLGDSQPDVQDAQGFDHEAADTLCENLPVAFSTSFDSSADSNRTREWTSSSPGASSSSSHVLQTLAHSPEAGRFVELVDGGWTPSSDAHHADASQEQELEHNSGGASSSTALAHGLFLLPAASSSEVEPEEPQQDADNSAASDSQYAQPGTEGGETEEVEHDGLQCGAVIQFCHFFSKGQCYSGYACKYEHRLGQSPPPHKNGKGPGSKMRDCLRAKKRRERRTQQP